MATKITINGRLLSLLEDGTLLNEKGKAYKGTKTKSGLRYLIRNKDKTKPMLASKLLAKYYLNNTAKYVAFKDQDVFNLSLDNLCPVNTMLEYNDIMNPIKKDEIWVDHNAGDRGTQRVKKYKSSCMSCGADKGYSFKNAIDLFCSSCASKEAVKRITPHHNFYGFRKRIEVGDRVILTRSSYESFYCEYLIKNNIDFEYESKKFVLKDNSTYLPDFYLTKCNTVIEIKGKEFEDEKYKKFIEEFPSVNFKLLKIEDLKELGYNNNLYNNNFNKNIEGVTWNFSILKGSDFKSKHGDDAVAYTLKDRKKVIFNEDEVNFHTIAHEMWHVFMSNCMIDSIDPTTSDIEEIGAELYSLKNRELIKYTMIVFEKLYSIMKNRYGLDIMTKLIYTDVVNEKSPYNKLISILDVDELIIKRVRSL